MNSTMTDLMTFGTTIAKRRKELSLSQKQLAENIRREDGESISPQYLNDIERDRRSPSSEHMVKQFAQVLNLEADHLYFLAGRIPADLLNLKVSPKQIEEAMVAFRKKLKR